MGDKKKERPKSQMFLLKMHDINRVTVRVDEKLTVVRRSNVKSEEVSEILVPDP